MNRKANRQKKEKKEAPKQPNSMFEASSKTGYTATMAWEVK